MKRRAVSALWSRALLILLALLLLISTAVVVAAWRTTVTADRVPRTIVPFSDLRRFQRMADEFRPERLRSGEQLAFEYSADDLQKIATLLANGHPRTAQTQFEILVTPVELSVQAWWPTGIGERYLPLRLIWDPDQPMSLQRLYIGDHGMPARLLSVVNNRLNAGDMGEQMRVLWQQYNPNIELYDQRLKLELEFQQTLTRSDAGHGSFER